jgi:hypothetical protein
MRRRAAPIRFEAVRASVVDVVVMTSSLAAYAIHVGRTGMTTPVAAPSSLSGYGAEQGTHKSPARIRGCGPGSSRLVARQAMRTERQVTQPSSFSNSLMSMVTIS